MVHIRKKKSGKTEEKENKPRRNQTEKKEKPEKNQETDASGS
jgi:hypothetical protein